MKLILCLLALAMLLAGCQADGRDNDPRLSVVATTTMIGDLVRQIGGENVNLYVLMGPNVDPHGYHARPADLARMRGADRVFYNGLHLEGKMAELLEERLGRRAVAVTRDIPPERLLPWEEEGEGAYDPHVWFDVSLWMIAAGTIRDELAAMDPENERQYAENTEALLERLAALHEHVGQRIATLSEDRRVLITSHDAFNYFGRAYGIDVRGLQGISTEQEPTLSQIRAAADFIAAQGIPAIFVESSVNPRLIQRVQADVRARGVEVAIGGELYSDALGAPGEHAEYEVHTYDGMMRYNVETMVGALSAR